MGRRLTALSVVLALAAAALFAVSAALQQTSARSTALAGQDASSPLAAPFTLIGRLARQPIWLAGLVINVVGFGVHALALRLGPIPVVQALLVAQLLFALPPAATRRRLRLLRRDWVGTALICAGLIVLVVQDMPHGPVDPGALPYGTVAVVGMVAVLVASAALTPIRRTQTRAALLGIAAGCCSCSTAVLVVAGLAALPHITWPLVGVAVSTALSGGLAQAAFASGSLPTALTAMTVADPALSYFAAGTLFLSVGHPAPVPLVCAAVLTVAGVVTLANSPTLHDEHDARQLTPADIRSTPAAAYQLET